MRPHSRTGAGTNEHSCPLPIGAAPRGYTAPRFHSQRDEGQTLSGMETIEVKEREPWNNLVLTLPNCELRQAFEWGEMQLQAGRVPYRFAVMGGDRCLAAIQLVAKRVRQLNCFVLYAPRGPMLLDWGD